MARSFWTALSLVATDPSTLWAKNVKERSLNLSECRTKLRNVGPLLIFPEATTSNGKGLLRFLGTEQGSVTSDLLEECHVEASSRADGKFTAYIIGLRYEYESFPPTIPVGSRVVHLLRLMSQVCAFWRNASEPVLIA